MTEKIAGFLLVLSLQAAGTVLPICPNCRHLTVENALEQANHGDTLLIKAGFHQVANLDITKPVTLQGEQGTILDGGHEGYVLKILCDSVTIDKLKIINSGRSYTKDYSAIYVSRAHYFSITNLEIDDPFFGILVEKSSHGYIGYNTLTGLARREDDAGNGIHLWHCSEVRVSSNEISHLRDGIYLEFVDNSQVQDNYAHDNVRYGLHFMFSNNDEYINNTFSDNGAGVAVMFSKFIRMTGNRFIENWGTASYGLLLKEIYDAEVVNNEFIKNTIGIFLEGSTRISYQRNVFSQNGWAVKVSGGCYSNVFEMNNFLGNSFDVSYNAKMNDNSFHGNYWSTYTGYDLDKDGIGDVPYRPVKLFSYIVNRTPETIVLLRSLFVDIVNFSEYVSPVFTPDDLMDRAPALFPF